ncbi:MAG: Bro-N domain-containing protein [Lachnospiraceae bacterium]
MINGEPFFVGKDVAEILGYADPNKAIAMHVDEEDKLNDKTASSLGQRGGWLINESGLYSLILSSKLPAAKRFKR